MDPSAKPVAPDQAAIAGVVSDASGKPLAWAAVLISGGPTHHDIAAATDGEGRYRLDSLEPGNYTLLANASGHAPKEGQVAASAGVLTRLDFTVE
jgi:hypothetical protein